MSRQRKKSRLHPFRALRTESARHHELLQLELRSALSTKISMKTERLRHESVRIRVAVHKQDTNEFHARENAFHVIGRLSPRARSLVVDRGSILPFALRGERSSASFQRMDVVLQRFLPFVVLDLLGRFRVAFPFPVSPDIHAPVQGFLPSSSVV